jgi:RNA polymerase sigma factor for flagellar operon FliA
VRTLDEAIHRLENATGHFPSEAELAGATGLGLQEVREGLEALQNQFCLSLDMLQDSFLPADGLSGENPFRQAASQELVDRMAELIDQLTPREKLVLSLYYADELNMRETAAVMGITEGRVSQLHSQALSRLRREFAARHGDMHV